MPLLTTVTTAVAPQLVLSTAGRAAALSTQPQPVGVIYNPCPVGDGWVTSITRQWASAGIARSRCHLCPKSRCHVTEYGVCNVLVVGLVPPESAPLFAFVGESSIIANQVKGQGVTD